MKLEFPKPVCGHKDCIGIKCYGVKEEGFGIKRRWNREQWLWAMLVGVNVLNVIVQLWSAIIKVVK